MLEANSFWRRVDVPGHDACRLSRLANGDWRLEGMAVFQDGPPAALEYVVECREDWVTRRARVRGWRGSGQVSIFIERATSGEWSLNGVALPGLANRLDVDLGFTPATNLIQLRRLALGVGEAADAPAAWFDVSTASVGPLDQRYERRDEATYWYEAPRFEYAGLLRVGGDGFVREYPGLWTAEGGTGAAPYDVGCIDGGGEGTRWAGSSTR